MISNNLIDYSQSHPDRIGLSEEKHEALEKLINFNCDKIYRHSEVEKFNRQAELALEGLFARLVEDLNKTDRLRRNRDELPQVPVYEVMDAFLRKIDYGPDESNALIALDFISGMTDNYVVRCLDELFVPKHVA